MNISFNLHQGQNVSQQLNLAPQLLHWLKLLQVPTTELAGIVQHELETNPALEASDVSFDELPPREEAVEAQPEALDPQPTDFSDADVTAKFESLMDIDGDWAGDTEGTSAAEQADDQERHNYVMESITGTGSMYEHLLKQLPLCHLTRAEALIAHSIIASLDERGYLASTLAELADQNDVDVAAVEPVLAKVQMLHPAGVAARDLRECLMLQMSEKDGGTFLPLRILREANELLAARQFAVIAQQFDVTEADVMDAVRHLATLNPTPAGAVIPQPVQYVTPDVAIEKKQGQYVVILNDTYIPRLRISSSCRRMLESGRKMSTADLTYIRNKIRGASFLIQGISQRQDTLRRVATEIARIQSVYFDSEHGELVPLTMAKVARTLGVHETTVSRAIANKYTTTPRGLFELKHFFKAGYACTDGSAVTPEKVKQFIVEMVGGEAHVAPLTDLQMVQQFKRRGLHVARRTVAKYREELGIANSKDRVTAPPAPRRRFTSVVPFETVADSSMSIAK